MVWFFYFIYGFICIFGYSKDIFFVWYIIFLVFVKVLILWNLLIYVFCSKVMKKVLVEMFLFLRWLI